jgi:uncharacterized protein (TIGR02118 family)
MIKVTFLLVRNPALSRKEFIDHHRNSHAALFMSVPIVQQTVRGYVQQHALELALPGLPEMKYDGITELWFDDVESFGRCFSDPEYVAKVRPDELTFLDLLACGLVISTENRVRNLLE